MDGWAIYQQCAWLVLSGALVGPIGDKAAVLRKARGWGRVYSTVGVWQRNVGVSLLVHTEMTVATGTGWGCSSCGGIVSVFDKACVTVFGGAAGLYLLGLSRERRRHAEGLDGSCGSVLCRGVWRLRVFFSL